MLCVSDDRPPAIAHHDQGRAFALTMGVPGPHDALFVVAHNQCRLPPNPP